MSLMVLMMKNRVIIFPTDTVYGIGASVYDKEGIDRIYKIKNRPYDKPLAVLCANEEQIDEIAYVSGKAKLIISTFLPGPLTVILPAKDNIKENMGLSMVGVRIPNSKIAQNILLENGPMATTSVNESGRVALNEYKIIKEQYNDVVDYIYETNEPSSNIASTVIYITDDGIKFLREGQIKYEDIIKLFN